MQPNENRNIVWIASYPKSGNTWVRSILYCATHGKVELNQMGDLIPSFTNCVERFANDRGLSEIDDAAELWGDTQQWISSLGGFRVIKTHNICGRIGGMPHPDPKLTHAAICVVRDPRDVAVSYANHYGRTLDQAAKLLQMEDNFTFQPDNPFRKSLVGSWQTNFTSWLDASFPVLAVRYEDLLAAPAQEITRILEFLNLKPAIPSREIASLTSFGNLSRLERLEGFDEVSEKAERFFRKGSAGQWRDHGVQIDSLTKAFRPLMMQLGYLKNEDS